MYKNVIKRALDIMGALILLVLLSPLMLLTWFVVLESLGQPVLFRQRRPGRYERCFEILKFRTMLPEVLPDGTRLQERQRVSRVGLWLRASSLDELPQLTNILRGEMSFVGPRPLLERYLPFYSAREKLRHRVRPGLSGWAQISGRNDVEWNRRLEMDAWYAEHISLSLDLRILLATVGTVFRRDGVREDPSLVMAALDEERSQQGTSQYA